ncbi:MAG: DUF4340 domain-containing protein [Myxococcota bacterium]
MDPVSAPLRGCAMLLLAVGLCTTGCERRASDPAPPASSAPVQPATSLRIAPAELTRLEVEVPRASGKSTFVLERREGTWHLVSPVADAANGPIVDSMVAVLGEIRIVSARAGTERDLRRFGLDERTGIEVKGWRGQRLASHFVVGYSEHERTYVKVPGDDRIRTMAGRCRRLFERTVSDLRNPAVMGIDVRDVRAVTYDNQRGRLQLVAAPHEGGFVPKGRPIPNYDRGRATKNVAVLAGLLARGFVDDPSRRSDTGLFEPDTASATLQVDGPQGHREIRVWFGNRRPDGLLPVRTSLSERVYLVSGHLDSSLRVHRAQLERSDDMMRQLRKHRERHEGHDDGDGPGDGNGGHTHHHASPPPDRVPDALLRTLRELAREQRLTSSEQPDQ